jgi:hypothetical protein
MIFLRVHFKDRMISGALTGTKGVSYVSGWMTVETFPEFLKHFQRQTRCGFSSNVLLIMDIHASHISPESVEYAKLNGIVILTIPPHTSHKLQPLDRSVFGPLKAHYNRAADAWMLNHPGQLIKIDNIAELLGTAFTQAFTPQNIQSGFRVSGVYSFNRDIFTDDEFLSSYVSDRAEQATPSINPHESNDLSKPSTSSSASSELREETPVCPNISLEQISPHPKASARKNITNRKRTKSIIATDTPVKNQMMKDFAEQTAKAKRKKKVRSNKAKISKKKGKKTQSFDTIEYSG